MNQTAPDVELTPATYAMNSLVCTKESEHSLIFLSYNRAFIQAVPLRWSVCLIKQKAALSVVLSSRNTASQSLLSPVEQRPFNDRAFGKAMSATSCKITLQAKRHWFGKNILERKKRWKSQLELSNASRNSSKMPWMCAKMFSACITSHCAKIMLMLIMFAPLEDRWQRK